MSSEGFLQIIIIVIVLVSAFLVSLYLTGRVEREYDVIEPDKTVIFKDTSLKTENLATIYLPEFFFPKELQDPKPELVTYEIIQNKNNFSIVYRLIYPTENVPSFYLNKIYSEFRKLYYGSEKDIEFVQIDINKETGIIDRILFETSSVSYNSLLQKHIPVEIINEEDKYSLKLGEEKRYFNNIPLNETHLQLVVISWNHLFNLLNNATDYIKIENLNLSFLDEKIYKDYKMSRRSNGDFKSNENFDKYIIFILLSIFGLVIFKFKRLI